MVFIYVVAFLATFVALVAKRTQDLDGRTKTFRYALTKSSLEFLVPLDIVLLLYAAFLFFRPSWDDVPVADLIRWEQRLETLRIITGGLKLGPLAIFAVLLVLWGFGLLRPDVRKVPEKTRKAVVTSNRWIGRVYAFLVLLCTITLFGTQAGPVSDELKLKIKLTRDGYADLRNELGQALAEEVAYRAADKAAADLPPAYRDALAAAPRITEQRAKLDTLYGEARTAHRVASPVADRVLAATTTRVEAPARRSLMGEISKPVRVEPPPKITLRNVNESRAQLRTLREERHARANWFVEAPGGREVVLHLPKLATYAAKKALVGEWASSYPLLSPLIDVVTRAVDDRMRQEVTRRLDGLRDRVLADPKKAPVLVEEQALQIVDAARPAADDAARTRAESTAATINARLRELDTAIEDVESRSKAAVRAEIDREIGRLSSSNSDTRETAVERLTQLGGSLEQRHVERLVVLARQDEPSWTTEEEREEGHHCTWYTETSVRHYAGRVLKSCGSRHVTPRMTEVADNAIDNGERRYKVTDPGWV